MDSKLSNFTKGFKLYLLASLFIYTILSLIVLVYLYTTPIDINTLTTNVFLTLGVVSVIGITSVIGILYFRKWGIHWFLFAISINLCIALLFKSPIQVVIYLILSFILVKNVKPIWKQFK